MWYSWHPAQHLAHIKIIVDQLNRILGKDNYMYNNKYRVEQK